ncbi:MAG: hypothetical protein AB1673_03490 [Actinomycetota bacterium]
MRTRAMPAAVVLTAIAVLTACSDNKSDDGQVGPTTTRFPPTVPVTNVEIAQGAGVCGFLTAAEVQAATSLASRPGTGTRASTSESCRWTLTGTGQFVALVLSPAGGTDQFDRSRQLFGAREVEGVGDRAFVVNDAAYTLKGDRLLIVQVVTTQTLQVRNQAAVTLARSAVNRL